MNSVRHAITIFTGFLQTSYDEASGMIRIDNDVRGLSSGSDVRVGLYPWNASASGIAETLHRLRDKEVGQRHVVMGYSYGGDRAVKLCKQLQRRNTFVQHLILVDPVRRWDYVPGIAAPFGAGRLRVPDSVASVTGWRQTGKRWGWRWFPFEPAGHRVTHGGVGVDLTVLDKDHGNIDGDEMVRAGCLEICRQFLEGTNATT